MHEIMSRVRPFAFKRRRIFMPSEARLKIYLKKYIIRALKSPLYSHGPRGFFTKKNAKLCIRLIGPYLGQRGGAMAPLAPPLDPLLDYSQKKQKQTVTRSTNIHPNWLYHRCVKQNSFSVCKGHHFQNLNKRLCPRL